MDKLGLTPPEISTQVTQPEYVADYVYALTACWGVFANIADDFRHLQRSEIRELRDKKAADPKSQIVGLDDAAQGQPRTSRTSRAWSVRCVC